MDYKVDAYIRESLKAYHGSEPFDPKDYEVYWKPKLNKYHRDNLISLFNAIGYGDKAIPPFNVFNTGDWVGEIPQKLALPLVKDGRLVASYTIGEFDRPNQTREYIQNRLFIWLRGRLHAIDTKAAGEYCPFGASCHDAQARAILEI